MLWGSVNKKTMNPVNKCVRSAARLCSGKTNYDHVSMDIKNKLKWLMPKNMYIYKCCVFIHRFLNRNTPKYFDDVVNLTKHDGRNGTLCRTSTIPKNKFGDRLLESVAMQHYNNLPITLRDDNFLPCFKHNLYNFLLESQ